MPAVFKTSLLVIIGPLLLFKPSIAQLDESDSIYIELKAADSVFFEQWLQPERLEHSTQNDN